jgi:hypothetical protein
VGVMLVVGDRVMVRVRLFVGVGEMVTVGV